jgi:uncharacterized protein (DUF433 family)
VSFSRGAYPAERAAALSGVPLSTVPFWARSEILVPSISAERVKLWSYPDLMALRIVYWLRQPKTAADGARIPRSAMPAVRTALAQLAELDLRLWTEASGPSVAVRRDGGVVVRTASDPEARGRQRLLTGVDELQVLEPFAAQEGSRGPDLCEPRPRLRIVPGKLGGAPHVVHTRLESEALAALAESGIGLTKIHRLYPQVGVDAIEDALDLERQLSSNLRLALVAA